MRPRLFARLVVSKDSFRGYVLEEVLARLIRGAGYNLLVHPDQDRKELEMRGNGLVVRGRGTYHQADVLGQLQWIPAFTYPIRLFVEGKFRQSRTGLPAIRNAVGVLEDLNQNFFVIEDGRPHRSLVRRYSYRYALFSASGFTKDAVDMALAHQISLIDLNGPGFAPLRTAVEAITDLIYPEVEGLRGQPRVSVPAARAELRQLLGTWPENLPVPWETANAMPDARVKLPGLQHSRAEVSSIVEDLEELFLAMSAAPFLIVLRPEDAQAFLAYARLRRTHPVLIHWSMRGGHPESWWIEPRDRPGAYKLWFDLPEDLAAWIFADPDRAQSLALRVKGELFTDLTIYHTSAEGDEVFRLTFDVDDAVRGLGARRAA